VVEGVAFNLAHYVEILEATSQMAARQVILSGNGFLEPSISRILASLVRAEVLMPPAAGMATLRGAAVSAWRALGHDPALAIEGVVDRAERVATLADHALVERYGRYKQLRVRALEL
jgi:sugar (pentulose or hexulose) kinase